MFADNVAGEDLVKDKRQAINRADVSEAEEKVGADLVLQVCGDSNKKVWTTNVSDSLLLRGPLLYSADACLVSLDLTPFTLRQFTLCGCDEICIFGFRNLRGAALTPLWFSCLV